MKKLDLAEALITLSTSNQMGLIEYERKDDEIEVWQKNLKNSFRATDIINLLQAFSTFLIYDESEQTLKLIVS
jgi:hypothetical protein